MKVNINNNALLIDKKTFNLDQVDFILLNGRLRIYSSDGVVEAVFAGYTPEEIKEGYLKIANKLTSFQTSFVNVKGKLINVENIKNIQHNKHCTQLTTKGYTLQLIDLDNEDILTINDKIKEISNNQQVV